MQRGVRPSGLGFLQDGLQTLACELQDTLTPEGLREALCAKLPWKFREWTLHKEQEEDRKKPTVEIVFPIHIPDVLSLKATLKAVVGQAPKEATNLGGNRWRLVYDKKREMEGLLGIDGMKLDGVRGD